MKVVRLSALGTGRLYPRKYSWYSFLLESKSTPGPQCGRKNYVNEKFQWHKRKSNPRPSGLYRSALTNCATACTEISNSPDLNCPQIPIQKFTFYIIPNKFRVCYADQLVDTAEGSNRGLLRIRQTRLNDNHVTHRPKDAVWSKCWIVCACSKRQRKATINFVISVRSGATERNPSPTDGFSWNFVFGIFSKIWQQRPCLVNIEQK